MPQIVLLKKYGTERYKKKVTKMEMVVEFMNLVMNLSEFLGQLNSSLHHGIM
jgi:cell fate (sporulation/competence/biofilm development) regulator YlbF (YheA/YmcA/DUF963 family)